MKKIFVTFLIVFGFILFFDAQVLQPFIEFSDDPYNHNMGLTFDGQYYYTVNGGSISGKINKYTTSGVFIASYPIDIDMRSIEYYNHNFYVSSCDGSIYKISNLEKGKYSVLFQNFYSECQTSFAINKSHNSFYILSDNELKEYHFATGDLINSFNNIKTGSNTEQNTVACTDDYFYTFDASEHEIYEYDFNANLNHTYSYSKGSYSFSLSSAGNDIFISDDGNYSTGTWYGYKINSFSQIDIDNFQSGYVILNPTIEFSDDPYNHNMGLTFDGQYYYTVNGGSAASGKINKYNDDGDFIASFPIEIDMRSIEYYNQNFYVSSCDGSIYKISNLEKGKYSVLFQNFYSECQTSFAINKSHNSFYIMNGTNIKEYDLNSGNIISQFDNIQSGSSIELYTIACSDQFFYTFDVDQKNIYEYDFSGNLLNTYTFAKGSYGFSLSFANNMVFVSDDGDYSTGTWYGYILSTPNSKGKTNGGGGETHKGKH
ncbi:MAG: hypothetical protein JXR68_06980 [Bacteroidales bacterium]|nr:hypothetical protein [Bacteroidales bacterium]